METDYWKLFAESGSVLDYLKYKNSVSSSMPQQVKNEQSNTDSERDSTKGNQDQGK